MMYLRWVILALIGLVVTLVQVILSPILALWPERLPKALNWFQTQDNSLMGDGGHYARWQGWPAYIQRIAWLIRNPSDGYDTSFGATVTLPLAWEGDKTIGAGAGISGICKAKQGKYFMVYYIRQWGNSGRCIRLYMGWKLMGAINSGQTGPFMLVCAFNPVTGFGNNK